MSACRHFLLAAAALVGCEHSGSQHADTTPTPVAAARVTPPPVVNQVGPISPRRVLFDPIDRDRLLVVEASGMTSIWALANGRQPVKETSISAPAADARFVPGQRSIVTAGRDGSVVRWDGLGRARWKTPANETVSLRAIAVSPDGRVVASGGDDAAIRFWSAGGVALGSLDGAHHPSILSLAFSTNGDWLASEGTDSLVRLWRRAPDGKSFAPAMVVRQVTKPYDKMLPNLVRFDVQWGWGQSVVFSPAGDLLLTANLDGTARLWNLDGSPHTAPFTNHSKHHVRAVAFSARGDTLASGGFDGMVRLWSTDGRETGVRLRHPAIVTSVAFAPGGERIATAAMDDRVRLWRGDGALEAVLPASPKPQP